MSIQQWAVFFTTLLSFDYAAATYFGHYGGVSKEYDDDDAGYYGWSQGCRCNDALARRLDITLGNIRSDMDEQYDLMDYSLEEYDLRYGRATGFYRFERSGPYRCSVTRDYARIIFRIGFLRLLVHYKLSILDDILTGFMGGLGSVISHFIGRVTDYVLRIILPDLYVSIVLIQHFGDSHGITLEGFYISQIDKILYQNEHFARHANSFTPYMRPVMDHAVRKVCRDKLQSHFNEHFRKVRVERKMFYYNSSSREYEYGNGEYERKRESNKRATHTKDDDSSAALGKHTNTYKEEQDDDDDDNNDE